jgi:hypothetical protein
MTVFSPSPCLRSVVQRAGGLIMVALISACDAPGGPQLTASAVGAVLQPNPDLRVQGNPPIFKFYAIVTFVETVLLPQR